MALAVVMVIIIYHILTLSDYKLNDNSDLVQRKKWGPNQNPTVNMNFSFR